MGAIVAAQFGGVIDDRLAGRSLSVEGRGAVTAVKERTLGAPDVRAVPAAERPVLQAAARDASVSAFRLGIGISAALVAAGGLLGAVGIRNERRDRRSDVRASECSGGQLVGAPQHAGRERGTAAPAPAGVA